MMIILHPLNSSRHKACGKTPLQTDQYIIDHGIQGGVKNVGHLIT